MLAKSFASRSCISLLLLFLTFSCNVLKAQADEITPYYKLSISGKVYQIFKYQGDYIVFDQDNNIIVEKYIIKKALFVGDIFGFSPIWAKNSKLVKFTENDIEPTMTKFQNTKNIIPAAEVSGTFAFDLAPKALAELTKIAITGGGSAASSAVQLSRSQVLEITKGISKSMLQEALVDMSRDPRPFIVSGLFDILNSSINNIKEVEQNLSFLKGFEIYPYEQTRNLYERYWDAKSNGYAAMAAYQSSMGSIESNIQKAIANFSFQAVNFDIVEKAYKYLDVTYNAAEATDTVIKFGETKKHWNKNKKDNENSYSVSNRINKSIEMATIYQSLSSIPNADLVAYYPFNGNTNDESGNHNHGRVYGTQLTRDRFGNEYNAYRFNGRDNYIDISSISSKISITHTRCAWLNTGMSGFAAIITTGNISNTGGCYLACNEGRVMIGGSSRNFWNSKLGNMYIADNKWHFICAVFINGRSGKIYVDGILDSQVSIDYGIGNWNTIIGKHQFKNQNYYDGSIDDVRIYNRILNENEIKALYNERR